MGYTPLIEKLTVPFPNDRIRQREGAGGKRFDYVSAGDVIERLLESIGDTPWSFEVISVHFREAESFTDKWGKPKSRDAFWWVHGRLTIEGVGTRDGIGSGRVENEDSIKGAETDALKRCAVKFGVALQLYRADDDSTLPEGYQEQAAAPVKQEVKSESPAKAKLNEVELQALLKAYKKAGETPPDDIANWTREQGVTEIRRLNPPAPKAVAA